MNAFPESDAMLATAQVRERCGKVSTMCLWRWQRDERVQFPPPDATINGRNYWRLSTIRAWQDRMTARAPTKIPAPAATRAPEPQAA
jgi:predicted DNA-binding transcriptional regulator AlpA